jgi:hypothetical protein
VGRSAWLNFTATMEKKRSYTAVADVPLLQRRVEDTLRLHELDVRTVPDSKGFVVHGSKDGTARDVTGTSYSLSVSARVGDAGTEVSVNEDIMGKAAVGVVLAILTGGLGALIPGWFAYQQHVIAEKVWRAVDDYMTELGRA